MPTITLSKNGAVVNSMETIPIKQDSSASHVSIGDGYLELMNVVTSGNDRLYRVATEKPHFVFTKDGIKKVVRPREFLTQSGRKVYRHQSLPGSVIEYVDFADNYTKRFLVLDTNYRTLRNAGWMSSLTYTAANVKDTQIWRATGAYYGKTNANGNSWLNGTGAGWPVMSDEVHYSLWSTCWDVKTATQNTAATYNFCENGKDYAVKHCYTTIIDGVRCQLPNIQQLRIMAVEAPYIDALDPTLDDTYNGLALTGRLESGVNSPFSFGERMFASGRYRFYSSTATLGYYSSGWDEYYGGILSVANSSKMSYMHFVYKAGDEDEYYGGVAPILEL